ncbi:MULTISPECIES: TrbC family F-type conjugative pilus assembly protein [Enterobacterales]|uniref:TraW n=7 Tax=Morganellaceae TaxID=1903414 RepID=A0A2L1KUE9_PROMI|nr:MULTISPECIES: TrbC family F-type conjugative pilus assembly protein [Enterobacterales]ELB1544937.1 conjugal transfer protein [Morganella morganii]MEB1123119.1 TrbC family F-type conjugative pilus assembly protein [Citrobacter freundii]HAZ8046741.1 conjugal transfer protein [Escherichia coli]AGX85654.1 K12061 conjugal transfer pilus assembly protein TraW [Providencia rettgeri]ARD70795.1 K12061 conjugal transfer pilus assembly protein TraW [Providencia rettgeri]
MVKKKVTLLISLLTLSITSSANSKLNMVTPYTESIPTVERSTDADMADLEKLKAVAAAQAEVHREATRQLIADKNVMANQAINKLTTDEGQILKEMIKSQNESESFNQQQKGNVFYILISASLKDTEVIDIMRSVSGRNDVILVVQGVRNKDSLVDEINHWHKLIRDTKSEVNFTIDPNIFIKYGVRTIPTIIHENDGEFVSLVHGISNVNYLDNKTGNMGVQGPVVEVIERNMLDLIEEGIKNLDFEKMKKDAYNRYWKNKDIYKFPEALKDSTHYVDPSVVIPQDILSPDGRIIAKKGRVNPMDVIPFNLKLIFFNPASEWQRIFAQQQYQNAKDENLIPTLIATDVYGDGWETFSDSNLYGDNATLYFIQEGMKERFGIRNVPSIVTGDDKQFIVNEYAERNY